MIFFDTTIKIKRLKATTGNLRALISTATGEASIQPIGKDPSELTDGQYGTIFVCYVEADLPVRQGDQISDRSGVIYIVKEMIDRGESPLPHKELTIIKQRT